MNLSILAQPKSLSCNRPQHPLLAMGFAADDADCYVVTVHGEPYKPPELRIGEVWRGR